MMNEFQVNQTFELSKTQADLLLSIQHKAMSMLGRLRVLRDGSIEVEDEWAENALEALSQSIRASVPTKVIKETEERSGMPWSVFIGHCLSWWEGIGQPQRGGSMCMPKGLTPQPDQDTRPQVKRAGQSLINPLGELAQIESGLSTWKPAEVTDNIQGVTHVTRPRPPTPVIPFLVILIERLASLDLFFSGLKWNQNRRVPLIRSSPPIWPIIAGALGAILLSGHSWWAPWPIMSFFGAGFGWVLSQLLGRKQFCGGIACQHSINSKSQFCPRCGGEFVR